MVLVSAARIAYEPRFMPIATVMYFLISVPETHYSIWLMNYRAIMGHSEKEKT